MTDTHVTKKGPCTSTSDIHDEKVLNLCYNGFYWPTLNPELNKTLNINNGPFQWFESLEIINPFHFTSATTDELSDENTSQDKNILTLQPVTDSSTHCKAYEANEARPKMFCTLSSVIDDHRMVNCSSTDETGLSIFDSYNHTTSLQNISPFYEHTNFGAVKGNLEENYKRASDDKLRELREKRRVRSKLYRARRKEEQVKLGQRVKDLEEINLSLMSQLTTLKMKVGLLKPLE